MKATRQEWVDDLKALDEMLYKFLVKHGRSGMNDLEMVYAIEDAVEYPRFHAEWVEDHGKDKWELGVALADTGYEVSELVDDHIRDGVTEEVMDALLAAGLVTEVEA